MFVTYINSYSIVYDIMINNFLMYEFVRYRRYMKSEYEIDIMNWCGMVIGMGMNAIHKYRNADLRL